MSFLDDLKKAGGFAWDVVVEGKGPEILAAAAKEHDDAHPPPRPPAPMTRGSSPSSPATSPASSSCGACGGDGVVVSQSGAPEWCPRGCRPRAAKGAR